MTRKILVIEDDRRHLEDARRFFETRPEVDVDYAGSYDTRKYDGLVKKLIWGLSGRSEECPHYDGVISDIYFPYMDRASYDVLGEDEPQPLGVYVARTLSKHNIPFVLNTAGNHHGAKYGWICLMAQDEEWPVVESGSGEMVRTGIEIEPKNWFAAYRTLELMLGEGLPPYKAFVKAREEAREWFGKTWNDWKKSEDAKRS